MTAKEKLQKRVDGLSEEDANIALLLVEQSLDDPMLRTLATAPEDDEPWTDEDEAAVAEGREDVSAGRTHSLDEVMRASSKPSEQ